MNMRAAVLRDYKLSMPIECVAVDEPRGDEVLAGFAKSAVNSRPSLVCGADTPQALPKVGNTSKR